MLAYPFNDIMIKVRTLFAKKNIAIFFKNFKLQDFQLPMSDYALILSAFSSISPVQAWPSGNQSIISYISLPRLNAIVKKTMEIVWSGFLGGIVLSLMVYLSMWLTLDGYVQKQLSLWIKYLQILILSFIFNLSCFMKIVVLGLFVNNLIPLDSFQILQIIVPHKILKIILTGNLFENSTNLVPDKSLQII